MSVSLSQFRWIACGGMRPSWRQRRTHPRRFAGAQVRKSAGCTGNLENSGIVNLADLTAPPKDSVVKIGNLLKESGLIKDCGRRIAHNCGKTLDCARRSPSIRCCHGERCKTWLG